MKLKRRKDLEPTLKKLFGDTIQRAFVSISERHCGEFIEADGNMVSIDYEDSLVIELTNGKFVEIFSSEWGSISNVDEIEIIKE